MDWRPHRRVDSLISERLDDELVIFDRLHQRGFTLTPAGLRIWEACDGDRSLAEIAAVVALPPEVVAEALQAFLDAGLLLAADGAGVTVPDGPAEPTTVSRCTVVGAGVKLAGIGAVGIPLMTSLALPAVAAAASQRNHPRNYGTASVSRGKCPAVSSCSPGSRCVFSPDDLHGCLRKVGASCGSQDYCTPVPGDQESSPVFENYPCPSTGYCSRSSSPS